MNYAKSMFLLFSILFTSMSYANCPAINELQLINEKWVTDSGWEFGAAVQQNRNEKPVRFNGVQIFDKPAGYKITCGYGISPTGEKSEIFLSKLFLTEQANSQQGRLQHSNSFSDWGGGFLFCGTMPPADAYQACSFHFVVNGVEIP